MRDILEMVLLVAFLFFFMMAAKIIHGGLTITVNQHAYTIEVK